MIIAKISSLATIIIVVVIILRFLLHHALTAPAIKGKCVCPDGSSPKNNKCSVQPNPKPIKCPDGSSMVDGNANVQMIQKYQMESVSVLLIAFAINGKCPKPSPPGSLTFLTVVKNIINNGIGNKKPSDFTITVTGNDPSPKFILSFF